MTQKVNDAYEIIKQQDYISFGKLLHETWLQKKKLHKSVSNVVINEIYNKAMDAGASGGKLLGAGAGGFILFYVPMTKKKNFLNSFKKHQVVQFEFSNNGSKIIYNSEKI